MSKKHFNFKSSIRDWYIRAFPSDQLGYRINPLATFAGAVKCMADGGDIYKYLGVGDSPVRENVFFKIAAITGVDYDAVYDLWLHHDEDECSRLVFLGDHPDCTVDRDWREQFDEVVSPSEQVRYDELLAAEEHRKAETFDSFMEVNETPMDEVRGAGIAMMLMQGIVFAEIAKKIDGPSEELNERIATSSASTTNRSTRRWNKSRARSESWKRRRPSTTRCAIPRNIPTRRISASQRAVPA